MGDLKTVLNLDAETGANVIGTEATPVLSLSNASTGPALKVNRFVATSSATIVSLNLAAPIAAANATIAGIHIQGASCASAAILSFTNRALTSVSTIAFISGGVAGTYALRVALSSGLFGWIPVLPDAAVTAIAV
jgi:hypothetical protein